jgi:UDP-N-acetylglucosamine--N-acetylmuramyl-(pentapeptide) pyrophosphoryl-undecaprenol N-acetylglucosamine transferase
MLELNAYPGLAVRRLSRKVNEIWLGSPEARTLLRPGTNTRIVDTGTPIAPPDPSIRGAAAERFGVTVSQAAEPPSRRAVILIVGGSQGAIPINRAVASWIETGAADPYQVIWVTGRGSYADFRRYHRPPGVQVFDFLDPMGPGYAVADLAMTRAGMMTIAELCAWGIPSILVPLPTAAADHQSANARAMEEAGASRMVPQAELTADRIDREVRELFERPDLLDSMRKSARNRARPDALESILTRFGILSG